MDKNTNTQIIKEELDKAGFVTQLSGSGIIVSLNRQVSVYEIELFLENNDLDKLAYAKRHCRNFDKVLVVLY